METDGNRFLEKLCTSLKPTEDLVEPEQKVAYSEISNDLVGFLILATKNRISLSSSCIINGNI